jgi:hypothetical protein
MPRRRHFVPRAPHELPLGAPVRLTLADAGHVLRLAACVLDAEGQPFLTPARAVSPALGVASRVAKELERFRPPAPPSLCDDLPAPDREAAAVLLASQPTPCGPKRTARSRR